ncbi:glycoside hydrolase family protein [Ferruginibacter profundus]
MFTKLFLGVLICTAFSCKKSDTVSSTANTTPFQPGPKLTVAKSVDMGGVRIDLNPDTIYSSTNNGLAKFAPLPAGVEDAIVSFYLPRGYMATFAENSDGTGASSCYVAAQSAITANLSTAVRRKVSFIRYIPVNNPLKKGIASVDSNAVKLFSASWYYGWSINRPSFGTEQFVPMTWGKGTATIDNVGYLAGRPDVDHLLSFNEPDNASQANIPIIDTAIARYKTMMQSGLRLGSPVTTQDQMSGAGKWGTNFMAAAQALQLRVDFIPLHWYDWGNQTNNQATDSLTAEAVFGRFKNYMDKIHTAYPAQQLWVTEFNANATRTSAVVHKYFMKLASDWMNATDYIERYSYFFPAAVPAVDATGALTDAGKYWNNLVSPVAFPANIQ